MVTPLGDFHHPYRLEKNFDENYKKAVEYAKKGVPARDIVMGIFNITIKQFYNWQDFYHDDVEHGFDASESKLIKLFDALKKEDTHLHMRLSETAVSMAIDDRNPVMVQFLLKTKYGYSEKTKQEIEFNNEDTPIKFEIVDMTPNDEEEE